MNILVGISYSPWTEKASWALNKAGVPYKYKNHEVIFGMPMLAWQAKRPMGEITVPLLLHDDGPSIMGSFEIAKSQAQILFPAAHLETIEKLEKLSEEILDLTRALSMIRVERSPELQIGSLPDYVPAPVKPFLTSLARLGLSYLRKHFPAPLTYEQSLQKMDALLEQMRAIWQNRSSEFVCGDSFSHADIICAVTLMGVEPVAQEFHKLPKAIRQAFATPELKEKYKDMLTWRDQVYVKYRR